MKNVSLHGGTTRLTIIIRPIGLAFKFPRFDFWFGVLVFWRTLVLLYEVHAQRQNSKKSLLKVHMKYFLRGQTERCGSLMYWWFRGFFANINEARFYACHRKNPLLIPTYFSLFGFVNVQPIVRPIPSRSIGLLQKFWKMTETPEEMYEHDSHAWEDENFTEREDGTIALYDYGSARAFPMVKKYGHLFSQVLQQTA